jgi:penicillin-binding protein 1A
MRVAVAGRPVENFATDVTFPERLEGEEPLLGEEADAQLVDENGMPIEGQPVPEDPGLSPGTEPEPLDEGFIDRAIGRRPVDEQQEIEPPQ